MHTNGRMPTYMVGGLQCGSVRIVSNHATEARNRAAEASKHIMTILCKNGSARRLDRVAVGCGRNQKDERPRLPRPGWFNARNRWNIISTPPF